MTTHPTYPPTPDEYKATCAELDTARSLLTPRVLAWLGASPVQARIRENLTAGPTCAHCKQPTPKSHWDRRLDRWACEPDRPPNTPTTKEAA